MASVPMGRLSVCCMSGGHNPARLASILGLFGSVADEIVVAVEESRALATHEAVGQVADRVLSFPPTDVPRPADSLAFRSVLWGVDTEHRR